MTPAFFPRPADFRAWLEKHHATEKELLVGFHKKDSGRPSITWPESVDQALCFGWIDGIRKRVDEVSYTIRFTPRKASSNWSAVNMKRMAELRKLKLVHPAGLAAFERRAPERTGIYSYENRKSAKLDAAQEKTFRANKKAWEFFQAQPPGYRQIVTWSIITAKQEQTRATRLAKVIDYCARGKRLL